MSMQRRKPQRKTTLRIQSPRHQNQRSNLLLSETSFLSPLPPTMKPRSTHISSSSVCSAQLTPEESRKRRIARFLGPRSCSTRRKHWKLVEACRGVALLTWTINETATPRRPLRRSFVHFNVNRVCAAVAVARETKIRRRERATSAAGSGLLRRTSGWNIPTKLTSAPHADVPSFPTGPPPPPHPVVWKLIHQVRALDWIRAYIFCAYIVQLEPVHRLLSWSRREVPVSISVTSHFRRNFRAFDVRLYQVFFSIHALLTYSYRARVR